MRFFLVVLFLFAGCAQKSLYTPHLHTIQTHRRVRALAVEDVEVPQYLLLDRIVVLEGEKRTTKPLHFAGDPEEVLTRHFIAFLRQAFAKSQVCHYPWQVCDEVACRVRLMIDDLYLSEDGGRIAAVLEIGKNRQPVSVACKGCKGVQESLDRLLSRLFARAAFLIAAACQRGR